MYEKNNLDTFRILFLIKGILALVFSLVPLIYVFIGQTVGKMAMADPNPPPFDIATFFSAIGFFGFAWLVFVGVMALLASKYIREERKYTFIIVAAVVNGLSGILGLLLCIFTIIELNKNYAREIFGRNR